MKIKNTILSLWGKLINAKKILLFSGLAVLAIFGISRIPGFAATSDESTNLRVKMQRIVQEVAMAYYRKGQKIEYDSWRRNDRISPEQITSQNVSYMVCSGFTASVYKEAFDVNVPSTTQRIKSYAASLADEGNLKKISDHEYTGTRAHGEIAYYTDDFHGVRLVGSSSNEGDLAKRKAYREKILNLLEPGDVISTFGKYYDNSTTGHAMLVYKIIERNGKRVNAVLLNSNGQTTYNNNNITKGIKITEKSVLIDDSEFASNTFKEGTVYTHYLFDDGDDIHSISDDTFENADFNNGIIGTSKAHFTVLRMLWNVGDTEGTIADILCAGSCFQNENLKHISLSDLSEIPSRSLVRLSYPGIQIEKTVDVHNGSTVSRGDQLTYTITIKNNSGQKYSNIAVAEYFDTSLVEFVSAGESATRDGGTITWSNVSVAKGATKTITYIVKVKDNVAYGQTIESTGSVAGIPSTTVSNTINEKLTSSEKNDIKTIYNSVKTSKNGIALIKEVYKNVDPTFVQALEDVNLEELLGYQYDKNYDCVIPSGVAISAADYGNMLITPRKRSSKYTYSTSINDKPVVNSSNIFSVKVFNNYYSMLHDLYMLTSTSPQLCVSNAQQLAWQRATTASVDANGNIIIIDFSTGANKRSDRQVRVYPETLQTGDVLLYRNNNDTRKKIDSTAEAGDGEDDDTSQGDSSTVTPYWERRGLENGFYAYVYLENGSKGAGFYGGTYNMRRAKIVDESIVAYNGTKTDKYERFISADNTKDSDTLQSLFSKDYYVILRPSIRQSQIVTFTDPTATVSKAVGGDTTFTNAATTTGDGTISYESGNSDVATVNNSGKVTIRGAGQTTITATASKTFKYALASKSYSLVVNKASQVVSFAQTSVNKYLGDEPFTNLATTTGDGTISYRSNKTSVATVDANTGLVTIVGVGKATITATAAESDNYLSASKSYTLTVSNKPTQTVSFVSSSVEKDLGDEPFTNLATTTGDGEITYSSDNTNVATVDASTGLVTIVGAGSATITATAAETANYAASSESYILTVTTKQLQTITFENASVQKVFGDAPFTNLATTTGDGAITYRSSKTSVATIDSNTGLITIVGVGRTTITATAAETETYAPASKSFVLTVTKATQTIVFDSASVQVTVDANPFTNTATASDGGTITYSLDNTNVATINEETGEVTIVGAGTTTITATATETDNFASVSNSYVLTVNKLSQTVSFRKRSINVSVGEPSFTNLATTTGDGAIVYSSSDTNVATINENTGEVTIVGVGAATITATAAETRTYNSATDSYTLRVHESEADLVVTLTYDANGGSFPSDAQATATCVLEDEDCSMIISDLEPTKEGYIFLGWSESRNATEYLYRPGNTIILVGNTTIYAIWSDGELVWIDGSEYTIGSEQGLVLKIDHPISAFRRILVDDRTVDTKNYTAESGSTIITLSPEFLGTLSVGEHSIRAIFNNDVSVSSSFSVIRGEDLAPATPDTGVNNSDDKGSSIGVVIGLPTIAMLAAVILFFRRKNHSFLRGEIDFLP